MPSNLKRHQSTGHDHFITFTCYKRRPLLNTEKAQTILEAVLEDQRARHSFHIYAYVVMPNHVHLLLSEPPETQLSKILNVLKTQTSRQLPTRDDDPFWQTRYYDLNIFTWGMFREKRVYIHRNPVAEGLVLEPEHWPWSSFRQYMTGEPGRITITKTFAIPSQPTFPPINP
jgi:putative transposase